MIVSTGSPCVTARASFSSAQADLCVPRLNEGDQVVLINGRDITEHTHDQVVMFIKASCESHSGELILLVRPNGECCAPPPVKHAPLSADLPRICCGSINRSIGGPRMHNAH